jgi:hypothetical protein
MRCLAFVVGISKYSDPSYQLNNAGNDAVEIAKKLKELGFAVILGQDLLLEQFDRSIKEFEEKLREFDAGVFFYAGHGFQIKGLNYLSAVDTNFIDEYSVLYRSIKLDEIIERMDESGVKTKVIILDACRDNPFEKKYRGNGSEGLAPVRAPRGTIIAFSTSPGDRAQDGIPGKNSIYTTALLQHIGDRHITIEEFFKRVRTAVHSNSAGKQTSWEHTSLIGDFYFSDWKILPHSKIEYSDAAIADREFIKSALDQFNIVAGFRSHDWYQQRDAIKKFEDESISVFTNDMLFVVGRNILQAATGGENRANWIIENLESWLSHYNDNYGPHILNGMLFEIYFNSYGKLREVKFKIEKAGPIFELGYTRIGFQKSFEFIEGVLRSLDFRYPSIFIPSWPLKRYPLEIVISEKNPSNTDEGGLLWNINMITQSNVDILMSTSQSRNSEYTLTQLYQRLSGEIGVPTKFLNVTFNCDTQSGWFRLPSSGRLLKPPIGA